MIDRLQIRACAILWQEGAVLVQAPSKNPSRWALPGGRLEKGETLQDCLRREFAEEMVVDLRPGRLVFVHENFFNDAGIVTQEYGFYFVCATGHDPGELRARTAQPLEQHLLFRWVAAAELSRLALFPTFLRSRLAALPPQVEFLSTRDHPSACA